MWPRQKRVALSKVLWISLIVLVLIVAVAAYEVSTAPSSSGGTALTLHIYEDNPVLQEDHFYPDTFYVPLNSNISIAIQNLDDETRVFTLGPFMANLTIASGTTQRMTFTANKVGNFTFMSPVTPPSVASGNLKGPCLVGFFYVTQNATLLTRTTTSGTGVAPSEAQVIAANDASIGGCTAHPLTIP